MKPSLECLSLARVATLLGYKDLRSVHKWCRNHSVAILSDQGSRLKYVIKSEFEAARLQTIVKYLRTRYSERQLPKVLVAHQNGDVAFLLSLHKDTKKKSIPVQTSSGKHASRFLSDLRQYLTGI